MKFNRLKILIQIILFIWIMFFIYWDFVLLRGLTKRFFICISDANTKDVSEQLPNGHSYDYKEVQQEISENESTFENFSITR